MKSLYVTSISTFSGKTAICLGLGLRMQAAGLKVGYIKPVSTQPWQVQGRLADEDADFVRKILDLDEQPWELSPVIITPQLLRRALKGELDRDLKAEVQAAFEKVSQDRDVVLVEGGASLREGYAVGLNSMMVAEMLGTVVLVVLRYRDGMRVVDDALAAQKRLGDRLCGVVINTVPDDDMGFISEIAAPFLEDKGIPVFGILPRRRQLMAMSVGELVQVLDAKVLTGEDKMDVLVENLLVGAMTVEAAMPHFRRQPNKAVITGGDRADIQAAALETSTRCLILTGNLHPSPSLVKRAEELGVPVLLVRTNTMETVEAIEQVFGKTRLGQAEKLNRFQAMLAEHLDYDRLVATLGL